MLTGIRSLVLCEKVEIAGDGRVTYHDVFSDPVRADTNPGLVSVDLALCIESDGRATTGRVEVRTADFRHSYPLSVEAGDRLVAVLLMVAIPIVRDGYLTVTVVEDARRAKPLKARWGLAPYQDAPELSADYVPEIMAVAEQVATLRNAGAPRLQ